MLHGASDMQTLNIWRKLLLHLSHDLVHKLATISTGIYIGDPRTQSVNQHCKACLQAARYKHFSRIPRLPVTKLLKIVHIDIKCPCNLANVHGFRY